MVTIADLKPIELARKAVMERLTKQARDEDEFTTEEKKTIWELIRLGFVEWDQLASGDWFWLSEKGWHALGYEVPDGYGNPKCEDCEGTGRDDWADEGEDDTCWICDGEGVNLTIVQEFILLDQ